MKENKHIVLVEDDDDDIFLLKTAFEELNMLDKVQLFRNGQDALVYLQNQSEPPSFVISDLNMPVMNGFELLDELLKKNFFVNGNPQFVFLTTSEKSMIPSHSFGESQFSFFTKGYSYNQMKDTLSIITTGKA
ncbi:response regulator [Dyadobacter luticola]|uniref:Response regulator n=1 Tax=Dyadobacter luticola TaxID=1979387 RepID=A0A5R9KVW6_9BACT|nr:response regulator [Dyadobacter luticola]TLV00422.1 response regulator [Dyadobacter luticola]